MVRQRDSIVVSNDRIGYDLNELCRRLRLNIDKLIRQLYGEDAAISGQEWHVANATGGRGGGCVIERRGTKVGHWRDSNSYSRYREGDVLDLISVSKNLSTDGAIHWAAAWLDLVSQPHPDQSSLLSSIQPSVMVSDLPKVVHPEDDASPAHFEDGGGRNPGELFVESAIQTAGPENLARLESNLRRHPVALRQLFAEGLIPKTITKFHLGIKDPYQRTDGKTVSDALCYPVMSSVGEPLSRYGCYNIPGITQNPMGKKWWGRGKPITYYSDPIDGKDTLFVVGECKELWILDQNLAGTKLGEALVIISPSHGDDLPEEWEVPAFWTPWAAVYLGLREDKLGCRITRRLRSVCGREIRRVHIPRENGEGVIDFFLQGGTGEQFIRLLESAQVMRDSAPSPASASDHVGEFAADPININGAFANGYLYYPFTVERREVETADQKRGENALTVGRVVTSYVTKVLRSDGAVLDVVQLAAPKGTPREKRVLALTDGTRIEREPQPNHYATWQLDSLQGFIRTMQSEHPPSHRPLRELLYDVLAHLERSVWLPYREDYFVLALYIALSFVYQVFDAIPLVIVSGEKGTGKSELGDAVAKVAFNATIIGQGSAAGLIRLLNEARGLIVLDDLESLGRSLGESSFSDINQMLKLSYKKQTGRKAVTDKSGKTIIFDFYGPKIINNTQGVDPILGSRMLHIRTCKMPEAIRQAARITGSDAGDLMSLRNELHVWGMANARAVQEHHLKLMDRKGDRSDEISAPLRAISNISGDDNFRSLLELALARQSSRRSNVDDPVALLRAAIYNCVRQGAVRQLSATQLSLELHLIVDQNLPRDLAQEASVWQQPEWIGHQLRSLGIRDIREKVTRVRLYGIVTRVYELCGEYVGAIVDDLISAGAPAPTAKDPLIFCEQTTCDTCPYNLVCDATIPGLRKAKMLNKGNSGRKTALLSQE